MHRRPTDREHAVPPYWLRSRRPRGDARLASESRSHALEQSRASKFCEWFQGWCPLCTTRCVCTLCSPIGSYLPSAEGGFCVQEGTPSSVSVSFTLVVLANKWGVGAALIERERRPPRPGRQALASRHSTPGAPARRATTRPRPPQPTRVLVIQHVRLEVEEVGGVEVVDVRVTDHGHVAHRLSSPVSRR